VNAGEGTCSAGDEECKYNAAQTATQQEETTYTHKFPMRFVNKSQYRADVHWDDGKYGVHMAILEANGRDASLDTYQGHSFFITRHGVKEGLFDLENDIREKSDLSGDRPEILKMVKDRFNLFTGLRNLKGFFKASEVLFKGL
jgi:hypothetical protein